jgi:outer membrane protein OmpU
MNNFKKVGLSALAGSLVAFSANAGEISVAGSAGMYLEHINGGAANSGKSFSMGNQLTFTGGGELDNGLNVSVSFVIDQGDDTTTSVGAGTLTFGGSAPFDSHSVTVSSDSFGSITMHGEGMSSASGALDGMPSGDIWDAFQAAADEPEAAPGADGGLSYAFPSMMDGLALSASYTPSNGNAESSSAFGAVYTGVEGLTVTYAVGSDNNNATSEADHTVMKVTYAYGPVTVGYGNSEYDDAVAAGDQETEAYSVAYTVSDNLSVTYGSEELTFGQTSSSNVAAEFERIKVSYTAGGMTLTASSATGDNISYSTTATEDQEVWALGASFAF